MTENIVLGSGHLYCVPYTAGSELPADATIEVDDNLLGYIKGGATLSYKPETYEIYDDLYHVHHNYVISDEVTFKSGVLTWDLDTLKKLTLASTFSDDAETHVRTLNLGGSGARQIADYVIHFVHEYANGKKLRITLVGNASDGFELAFDPEKETVIDATFKAVSHGNNGVQVVIREEYEAAAPEEDEEEEPENPEGT